MSSYALNMARLRKLHRAYRAGRISASEYVAKLLCMPSKNRGRLKGIPSNRTRREAI